MTKKFDVMVVGAGAIGLSTSYLLSKHDLSVAVVAPFGDNSIATAAAGAMVDAFGEIEKLDTHREIAKLDFEVRAQRRFPSWLEEIEADSGEKVFSQSGIVVVANSGGEHDIPKMRLMREKMTDYGEAFEKLDVTDVVGLLPNYLYRAHEAFLSKSGLCVDTGQLLHALNVACRNSGKVTFLDESVASIAEVRGSTWCAKMKSSEEAIAPKVVVAAGAHSLNLIKDARLKAPKLYFGRGSSLTVVDGPKLPYTLRTPNRALSCGIHMVPQANERLYLGATNLFGIDYNNLPKGATCGEIHTLLEAIQNELNTSLRNISIETIHHGLRPVTQYDEPICGETNLEGLFIATGTHRTGVHMSPLLAQAIADSITGQTTLHQNPFDPNREFRANDDIDLRLGVRSLIATILFPTGRLPYNRMEEIETYLTELLKLAVTAETANGDSEALRNILRDIPLDEQGVLQTYHHVLENKLSEYGPYPS